MISWRYHLISIVAVFLALGLGLLMGTALLNDRLVENLKAGNERLQEQLAERTAGLASLTRFSGQVLPFVMQDRLAAQPVVIVTHEEVDGAALDAAENALAVAGVDVRAVLAVRPGLTTPSASELKTLRTLLALDDGTSPEDVTAAAIRALADRLVTGPSLSGSADVIDTLLSEGFVVAGNEIDPTRQIGGAGQSIVFVAGGTPEQASAAADALMPLIGELVQHDVVVAVGEPTTSTAEIVRTIRSDLQTSGPLVTVDDLELPAGSAALVLGLEVAIHDGSGGHYGVADDADRLLPAAA